MIISGLSQVIKCWKRNQGGEKCQNVVIMRQLLNKLLSPLLQLSPTCLIRLSADSSLLLLSRLSCPDSDSVWRVTRPEGWERKGDIFYLFCFPGLGCTSAKRAHQHISLLWSDWREETGGPGRGARCWARLAPQLFRYQLFPQPRDESGGNKRSGYLRPVNQEPGTSDWMTLQGSAALCCWHCEALLLTGGWRQIHPLTSPVSGRLSEWNIGHVWNCCRLKHRKNITHEWLLLRAHNVLGIKSGFYWRRHKR